MRPISVVLITKNEEKTIRQCVEALLPLTDDIVVMDSGSVDRTVALARSLGCRVYETDWLGYGATKNKGATLARYDWILSVDADEVADEELRSAIRSAYLDEPQRVYALRLTTYFERQRVRFGEWGRDRHVRLFHRQHTSWTEPRVHEAIRLFPDTRVVTLNGRLHHYTARNADHYLNKVKRYAHLSRMQQHETDPVVKGLKRWLAPAFHFAKSYVFLAGFLDGRTGWTVACLLFRYTWLKHGPATPTKAKRSLVAALPG